MTLYAIAENWAFSREAPEIRAELTASGVAGPFLARLKGGRRLAAVVGLAFALAAFSAGVVPLITARFGEIEGALISKAAEAVGLALAAWAALRPAKRAPDPGPVWEMGALFAPLFFALPCALEALKTVAWAAPATPKAAFWLAGGLSAFVDNAPTYALVGGWTAAAKGLDPNHLGDLASRFPESLAALSCGACWLGALTYVGNAPNALVRAVAERNGIRLPGFLGYAGLAAALLLPVFWAASWLFF